MCKVAPGELGGVLHLTGVRMSMGQTWGGGPWLDCSGPVVLTQAAGLPLYSQLQAVFFGVPGGSSLLLHLRQCSNLCVFPGA